MNTTFVVDIPLHPSNSVTNQPIDRAVAEMVYPLFKLLSDHNRFKIFALLVQGELCVCDIETETNLAQNLVSHHLRVLKEANLITARRDSRWTYYAINKTELAQVYPLLCTLFDPAKISDHETAC